MFANRFEHWQSGDTEPPMNSSHAPTCSAGWQPAVSPTGSRPRVGHAEGPQIANLRHSRLPVCATGPRGFSRLDLLAVLGCLTLFAGLVLPVLAGRTTPRSERVVCVNNLRQIGMAMQMWAGDNGNAYV